MPEDDIEIAACKRYASSRLFRSSWVTRAPQGDAYGTQRGSGVSVLTRMHRRADTGRSTHYDQHGQRGADANFGASLRPGHSRDKRRMKIDGHCHCGRITFEAE